MIKNMAMEDIILMLDIIILDYFRMVINMASEFFIIKMELYHIKVSGKME